MRLVGNSDADTVTSGIEKVAASSSSLLPATRALLAIDRPDGSGKTRFAERLRDQLGTRPVMLGRVSIVVDITTSEPRMIGTHEISAGGTGLRVVNSRPAALEP